MFKTAYNGLLYALFLSISFSQVVINELMVYPNNANYGESFSEFIELQNIGNESVDLEGWSISTTSGSAIISNLTIDSQGFAILAISDNANLNLGIPVDFAWGFGAGVSLSNSVDNVVLTNGDSQVVDTVTYNSSWGIAQGVSIELTNPLLDNNDLNNWVLGSVAYDVESNLGSPAAQNSGWIAVPGISLDPSVLDFGSVWLSESSSLDVIITNPGAADLNISGWGITDNEIETFDYSLPETPLTVESNESISFSVTFNALEDAISTDELTIYSNAGGSELFTYSISGRGGLPQLQVNTYSLVADSVYVPNYSDVWASFTNLGGFPLILDDPLFSSDDSDFSVLTEMPFSIAPESTDSIQIRFSPSSAYDINDVLNLLTNDPEDGQGAVDISLSGYGFMPQVTLSHNELTFPTIHSDQEVSLDVIVGNSGNGALEFSASATGSFSIAQVSSNSISPGSSSTVTVTFTPSYVGDYTGSLIINSNDPINTSVSTSLSATAITPTIVFVPLDSPSIQGAINMAEEGDTVLVSSGVYRESISTQGKDLTVMSTEGYENTIIEPSNIFGNGSWGDYSGGNIYTDDVRSALVSGGLGVTSIEVENTDGFLAGEEVLIMTMAHNEINEELNRTGQYEIKEINAVYGNTIELTSPTSYDFTIDSDTTIYKGLFNTDVNSYDSYDTYSTSYERVYCYEFFLHEKVELTKVKVFSGYKNWKIWENSSNEYLYGHDFEGTENNETLQWYEHELEEPVVLEEGWYTVGGVVGLTDNQHKVFYQNDLYAADWYRNFTHGETNYTYHSDSYYNESEYNNYPQDSGYGGFYSYGLMLDFEYRIADPAIKHQAILVPQYNNFEINNASVSAHPWDGKTGGVLFMKVKGTFRNYSTVQMNAKGYRGGYAASANYNYFSGGCTGEGALGGSVCANYEGSNYEDYNQSGVPEYQVYPRLNAGGGGTTYFRGAGHGGGNGGSGGMGYNSYFTDSSFDNEIGNQQLTKIYMGGGGGSGSKLSSTGSPRKRGGNGGGIIMIYAYNFDQKDDIRSYGGGGQESGSDDYPSGGGGAGGSVLIKSKFFNKSSGWSINVRGGGSYTSSYGGGGGAGGRIALYTNVGDNYWNGYYDFCSESSYNEGTCGTHYSTEDFIFFNDYSFIAEDKSSNFILDGFTFKGGRNLSLINSDLTISNSKIVSTKNYRSDGRNNDYSSLLLNIQGGSPTFEGVVFENQTLDYNDVYGNGTWINLNAENVNFNSCSFNNLHTTNANINSRYGNVIYHESGNASFNGCTFNGNTLSGSADLKGGVYYLESGSASFASSEFKHNTVTGSNHTGGIFYNVGGDLSFNACNLDSNTVALSSDGALIYSQASTSNILMNESNAGGNTGLSLIYFQSGGTFTGGDITINGNEGHVIYSASGELDLSLDGSDISNNGGQAIHANGSKIITSSSINYNSNTGIDGDGDQEFEDVVILENGSDGVNGDGEKNYSNVEISWNSQRGIDGDGDHNFDKVNILSNQSDGILSNGIKSYSEVVISFNQGDGIKGNGAQTFTDVDIEGNVGNGIDSNEDKTYTNVNIINNTLDGISGVGNTNFENIVVSNNGDNGISAAGNMNFNKVELDGNGGYAISNYGSVSLNDVQITSNGGRGLQDFTQLDANLVYVTGNQNGGLVGSGTVVLDSVYVVSNSTSSSGGGLSLNGDLTATNSLFQSNSGSNGGGLNIDGNASLTNCDVDSNSGSNGGGIYINGNLTAQNSNIISNNSSSNGGGIYSSGDLNLNLSHVNSNNSSSKGGGIWSDGTFSSDSTTVLLNVSSDHGAGIYGNGTLNVSFNDINSNTNEADGGGIWWGSGQVTVERSNIYFNHANRGGGVYIQAENPIFQYDVISSNDATTIGGGMYITKTSNASSTPIIFNSTVVYNTSSVLGSGLLCTSQTNPVVQNSIFWGNLAADGVQMHLQGASEIFVTYSNVAGGESGIVGFDDIIYQNNLSLEPVFVDTEEYDYTLQVTSPCIDSGNPNSPNDPDGTTADMGAYYFDQEQFNPGCMDQSAQNFDADANVNLGCIYGPSFISIYDAPDDQGGYVFVNWNANSLDVLPNTDITHYSVWRFLPNERGWEHLTDVPASYEDSYGFNAPTIETSTQGEDALLTTYKVKAHTAEQDVYYESGESTGFSLDNLSPNAPAMVYTEYDANLNALILDWDASEAPDLFGYSIYRDGAMIAESSENIFNDNSTVYTQAYEYAVGAIDFYNNTSISESFSTFAGIYGDTTGDQVVNVSDIIQVVNFILSDIDTSDYQLWSADVVINGAINIFDIISIISIILEN